MTTKRIMAAVALIVGGGLALHVMPAVQLEGIERTELQRRDLAVPGREVVSGTHRARYLRLMEPASRVWFHRFE